MATTLRSWACLSFVMLAACGATPAPEAARTEPSSASPAAPADRAAPAAAGAASPAGAWPFHTPSADESAQLLARVEREPGPIKSNWEPPARGERYGHAEGLVAAPYDAVRARLLDFAHYKDLAGPKFKNVRVVDKQAQATDLYFNLPIMKGLLTIWYVTRFTAPRPGQGGEVVEGTFVKGNIKGMHIAFAIQKGRDDKSTVMICDISLALNIPAPQANVDEELRDACGDAIHSVRRTTAPPTPP